MRPKHHRFLSYVLLATYAGISLLGDGLHMLLPEGGDQHHHHGIYVVGHGCHDSHHAAAHHDHDHAGCGCSEESELAISDTNADSHLCEICSFLVLAISQPAEVAAPIDWQPLVVAAHFDPQPTFSPTHLGPHAARGPPLLA